MTREDLIDYKSNKLYLIGRIQDLEEAKTEVTKITKIISDMPKGSREVQDSMAEKLAQIIDENNEIINEITELKEKEKKILIQLRQVEQPYKNILYKMYIKGKKLVDVASELGYDYKYICKKHGTALNKFDEKNTTKKV